MGYMSEKRECIRCGNEVNVFAEIPIIVLCNECKDYECKDMYCKLEHCSRCRHHVDTGLVRNQCETCAAQEDKMDSDNRKFDKERVKKGNVTCFIFQHENVLRVYMNGDSNIFATVMDILGEPTIVIEKKMRQFLMLSKNDCDIIWDNWNEMQNLRNS